MVVVDEANDLPRIVTECSSDMAATKFGCSNGRFVFHILMRKNAFPPLLVMVMQMTSFEPVA